MLCALPIFLIGLAVPVATDWHPTDLAPSAIISAQTCTTGPGAYAKATMTGAYMAGVQYGVAVEHAGFEFSVKPQLGLSYVDHAVRTLPARSQYHVGAEINVCYDRYCSGLSYAHMSTGDALGLCWSGNKCQPNIGEDLLAFSAGVRWR